MSVFDAFSEFNPEIAEKKSELEDTGETFFHDIISFLNENLLSIYPSLLALLKMAILMLPHASVSRYPEDSKSPTDIYTPNNPIVEFLPRMFKIHKKSLRDIRKLGKNISDFSESYSA